MVSRIVPPVPRQAARQLNHTARIVLPKETMLTYLPEVSENPPVMHATPCVLLCQQLWQDNRAPGFHRSMVIGCQTDIIHTGINVLSKHGSSHSLFAGGFTPII